MILQCTDDLPRPEDVRRVAGAVLMGQGVCTSLESGGSVEHNEHALMVGGRSVGEPDWTKDQADWLISAAVVNLCPQMQDALNPQ